MTYNTTVDLELCRDPLLAILREVASQPRLTHKQWSKLLKANLNPDGNFFGADDLILAYRTFSGDGTGTLPPFDPTVLERLRLRPVRTGSGVAVVTVLTKPFPCPGECIFCPNDVRMPKSYLADEPGAQRAANNSFDPYLQTYSRLTALYKIGHPTDKIEVIILGGTWSFYPETYQLWFVKRIFDALHDFGAGNDGRPAVEHLIREAAAVPSGAAGTLSNVMIDGAHFAQTYNQAIQAIYRDEFAHAREVADDLAINLHMRSAIDEYATWDELEAAHHQNEEAVCRCVGLVIETRPDHISVEEVLRIRRLGCTKVQIGFQSLNDEVLRKNRRGHTVAATRRAVNLLRRAGFKIHAHWMPNLYGSSPEADSADYALMFADPDFRPDELKIYPCSLIASAELMQRYLDGSWQPYTHAELVALLVECFRHTPEYCRLTRVIRDIPGTDIVVGNKVTNLRQVVEAELAAQGEHSRDIRAREIGSTAVEEGDLTLDEVMYATSVGTEIFLQFITAERRIAGFLRLLLGTEPPLCDELNGAAIIREVHVYGQALTIGESAIGKPQHLGLGSRLIERAVEIAAQHGYARLAVISAVGTRAYYRKRGFEDGKLYQVRSIQ
jgi:elongator complex protein 3